MSSCGWISYPYPSAELIKERYLAAAGWGEMVKVERDHGVRIYTDEFSPPRSDIFRRMREQLATGQRVIAETFPNAQTSSVDLAIDDVHSWDEYAGVVVAIRQGVLAKLSPATAEKVAYKNAVRIFRLKDPKE